MMMINRLEQLIVSSGSSGITLKASDLNIHRGGRGTILSVMSLIMSGKNILGEIKYFVILCSHYTLILLRFFNFLKTAYVFQKSSQIICLAVPVTFGADWFLTRQNDYRKSY
jgi:hypothetical protein